MPRLSQGPQPNNERGAPRALACMENVPPGAQAGALSGSSGVAQEGTGARPILGSPLRHPGESSSWYLTVWDPRPLLLSAPLPPLVWLSARRPLSPLPLVLVPLVSSSPPPSIPPLSARFSRSIPPPPSLPWPADESAALPPGMGFRPILLMTPLSDLAARYPVFDSLGRPRLSFASDPAPPLIGTGTATPGVADRPRTLWESRAVPLA